MSLHATTVKTELALGVGAMSYAIKDIVKSSLRPTDFKIDGEIRSDKWY